MSKEIEYYENLAKIMFKTRGCRFNAAAAMEYKDFLSVCTIAVLAIYLLGWSVVTLAYPEVFDPAHARFYAAMSAVASVTLLAISLVDFGLKRSVRAEKLHENALAITALMRELERELASSTPNLERIKEIAVEYERDVSQTHVNHGAKDLKRWIYATAASDNRWMESLFYIRRVLYNFWFYASSMYLYGILVMIVFGSTLWYTFVYVIR